MVKIKHSHGRRSKTAYIESIAVIVRGPPDMFRRTKPSSGVWSPPTSPLFKQEVTPTGGVAIPEVMQLISLPGKTGQ